MQKASVAVNESFAEIIDLPSLSTTTSIPTTIATTQATATATANQSDLDCQSELIDSNMEETCANVSTDNVIESNNDVVRNEKTALNALQNDDHKNMPNSTTTTTTATKVAISLSPGRPPVASESPTKNKTVVLKPPIVETISDDISATTEDIKRLKHVQVRSNSTGKLYQSSRRVSFPENDSELVTGYLEPADPWACGKSTNKDVNKTKYIEHRTSRPCLHESVSVLHIRPINASN